MCIDVDGYWSFHRVVQRRAAKEHRCDECRRVIAKGEVHWYSTGKWEDAFVQNRQCLQCRAATKWLEVVCSGWVYEMVLEDILEHLKGEESEVGSWELARLAVWMEHDWVFRGRLLTVEEVAAQTQKAVEAYLRRERAWQAGQVTP